MPKKLGQLQNCSLFRVSRVGPMHHCPSFVHQYRFCLLISVDHSCFEPQNVHGCPKLLDLKNLNMNVGESSVRLQKPFG